MERAAILKSENQTRNDHVDVHVQGVRATVTLIPKRLRINNSPVKPVKRHGMIAKVKGIRGGDPATQGILGLKILIGTKNPDHNRPVKTLAVDDRAIDLPTAMKMTAHKVAVRAIETVAILARIAEGHALTTVVNLATKMVAENDQQVVTEAAANEAAVISSVGRKNSWTAQWT